MVARPDKRLEAKDHAAESGDVALDDGERVYVAVGDVVSQKYVVDRVLGVGGVGFVLAARHVGLDGYFALKFLKKRFLHDKAIVERFTREAKAACRIKSEYVARVYDVGMHGGAPFIVMEHLVGCDLAALLSENGPFGVADATEYLIQACSALAVAHASGIIHRDIKPENLFLVDHEGVSTIKLLDFGISKVSLAPERPAGDWPEEGEPLTGSLICGTPYYMSPEQVRSTATVDARTDVWALGMVLYELLSGTTAFHAESVADICASILDKEPTSLADLRPDLPADLVAIVRHCLEKNPDDRYPSIAELAVALLPFAPPRALAIAEASAWIRRAAIRTVGAPVVAEGRISSGSIAALPVKDVRRSAPTTPRELRKTPASQDVAPAAGASAAATPTRRALAAVVVMAATVAIGGYCWMVRAQPSKGGPPSLAVPAAQQTPSRVPVAPAIAAPEPAGSPAPPASTPVLARSAAPAPVRVTPGARHVPVAPARPSVSVKPLPAPVATEAAAPAPTGPARPDLGY
jgi:serine/threonine-protein kinase